MIIPADPADPAEESRTFIVLVSSMLQKSIEFRTHIKKLPVVRETLLTDADKRFYNPPGHCRLSQ
jgi:hypothetical protein